MNFDKFVSTEIPNDNINDSVTVNHPYQNDRVPVQHTNQNVQVVLPKQNQTVKYCHGQNPWSPTLGRSGSKKGKYKNWLNVTNDNEQYLIGGILMTVS